MSATVRRVIRQSHRKSKLGCHACKRRRVKCDELMPTCNKCLALGLDCSYPLQDDQVAAAEGSSVWWPEAIEQSCVQWKESGQPPFPHLIIASSPSWHSIPMADLRYIYQMALVDSILNLSGTSDMCLLWGEIGLMIQLATRYKIVAYTLAATAAERLSVVTKASEASGDATRYRMLALRGIRQEAQSFSKSNSDAILCSYLGCSFLVHDYESLMEVISGIESTVKRMRPWIDQSLFNRIFALHCHRKRSTGPYTSTIQGIETLPAPLSHKAAVTNLLTEGIESLNSIANCFRRDLNLAAVIRHLRDALILSLEGIENVLPVKAQYRLIHPFISWFNRNSASSFTAVSNREPATLVFLLYVYSAFVALAAALPAINLTPFTSLRLRAILQICQALSDRPTLFCEACGGCHSIAHLIKFPLHAATLYRVIGNAKLELQG